VFAVVNGPEQAPIGQVIKVASSFGLESSTVVNGTDHTLVLLRLSHQGKSLEENEIGELSLKLGPALGMPGTP
jgi:hypothetical protein